MASTMSSNMGDGSDHFVSSQVSHQHIGSRVADDDGNEPDVIKYVCTPRFTV